MTDIKCPKCGSKARTELTKSTTCMYFPVQYDEDGKRIYTGGNTTTTRCVCDKCGEEYSYDD